MKTSILRVLSTVAAAAAAAGVVLAVAGDARSGGAPAGAAQPPAPVPETTTTTVAPTTSTLAPTTTSTTVAPTTTTVRRATTTTTTGPSRDPDADGSSASTLRPGDAGPEVTMLQRRLRSLGYWLGTPDGTYGELTRQAVMAFQKVEGLSADGVAGPTTRAALAEAGRPSARSASGDRIEVDKARQVLLVVTNGAVAWALNASTGTEQPYQVGGRTEVADTPPGRWKVAWEVDGVDVGELGGLYRPRYFHRDGIAVHGYHSVPAFPASHGCVRVSEPAMDWIWAEDLMPIGSEVWVY